MSACIAVAGSAGAADGTRSGDAERPAQLSGEIRKGYADTAFGQIHYRIIRPAGGSGKTPVALFHPNPYSGLYFTHFMDELGTDRTVVAFDTPGYGGSDKPAAPLSMSGIASAMAAALSAMGYGPDGGGPVDVSGYHTGAFIAAELAAGHPRFVRRAVLVGVPYWDEAERAKQRDLLLKDEPIPEDGSHLDDKWEFTVEDRHPYISIARAHDLFAERLRAGRETWWAYDAVVNWPATERLEAITQPVILLNNHGGLKEETRAVLPLLRDGRLVELPGLTHGIWDVGAGRLAREFRAFLDQ